MNLALLDYALLFGAGAAAGTVNVLAGGGSFLTLPVMIFLGLPPTVANGTNRIAILLQNVGAVWGFSRHRMVEWRWLRVVALPALVGAALGTWLALEVGDLAFQRILAVLMIAISALALWRPGSDPGDEDPAPPSTGTRAGVMVAAAFFLAGIYGGFIQAGLGFIILGITSAAGLDLVRGNALKVAVILVFTPLALALFALGGKVDWHAGLVLAAGNVTGAFLGVRLTVLKGHAWVRRVVTAAVVILAVKLLVSP